MKKLFTLCILLAFSSSIFAQDLKEKATKAKSKTERAVKAKSEKVDH